MSRGRKRLKYYCKSCTHKLNYHCIHCMTCPYCGTKGRERFEKIYSAIYADRGYKKIMYQCLDCGNRSYARDGSLTYRERYPDKDPRLK